MNRIKYIWGILIVLCCLQACYDDNSKLADQPIIEVNILPTAKDSINIYFNNTLEIKADIESETDALTYQWDMGLYAEDPKTGESTTVFKNISQEKDLSYVVRELGHYHLRQIVTSEDGSTIKYYHVFVYSQFEEGFTILERRPDGKGGISFLKTLTPEEIEAGMEPSFMQNAFAYANGGKELYLDPVDIDKVGNYLYILHGESQKLVQIDAKTFEEIYEYDGTYVYRNLHAGSIASLYYDGKEADRTSHFVRKTDACVEGSVDAKEDGTLMLAIPYRKGWNVYVDGVRQQIREYDYAFIATDIEAGQHTVVAKYENRLYVIGALLSLAGVVMFAGWVVKLC